MKSTNKSYEEDIDFILSFVHDALEELRKENLFDNWSIYENVDKEKYLRLIRQQTKYSGERTGTILMEKLENLKTKKNVKEEIYYLMDGNMPELDENPIGKKLNKLWKLINETPIKEYVPGQLKQKHREFVDRIRHCIRYQLHPEKYIIEEIQESKILDYPPTKDNLKECNKIYKDYMRERKEEAQRRFI